MVGTGSGTRIGRRRLMMMPRVAVIAAAALAAGVLAPAGPAAGAASGPPHASPGQSVAVHPVTAHPATIPQVQSSHPAPVSWPAAGTGTAAFTAQAAAANAPADSGSTGSGGGSAAMPAGPTPGSTQAGSTPVWIGPAATPATAPATTRQPTTANQVSYPAYGEHGPLAPRPAGAPIPAAPATPPATATTTPTASSPPTGDATTTAPSPVHSARVTVLSHQNASALGITGTVFTLTRTDGTVAPGPVHVSLNYAGFQSAYGGNYAARLHLVELPACATTTPKIAACRQQTALTSGNNVTTTQTGADVTLPSEIGRAHV